MLMIIDYDVGWISAYEGEEEEHLSPLGIREDHWAFHGSIRHHFPPCHHQHRICGIHHWLCNLEIDLSS